MKLMSQLDKHGKDKEVCDGKILGLIECAKKKDAEITKLAKAKGDSEMKVLEPTEQLKTNKRMMMGS
jgi:hypothetical protein